MTCIVSFRTKKSLKEAVRSGIPVIIRDPSIFNPRSFPILDLKEGETVIVTNHPRRSWFAQITRRKGQVLVR